LVNSLRVTEIMGCPRSHQYKVRKFPQHPPHFDAVRGTLTHYAIEKALNCKSLPDFDTVLEENAVKEDSYFSNQLFASLTALYENISDWMGKTKVDLHENMILGIEKEVKMPISKGYELVGHIDLLTKTHLIDFKSGGLSYNKNYKMQLGVYRELAKYEGFHDFAERGDWTLMNVFLGDDKAVEFIPEIEEVELLLPEYYDNLFKFIEYDKKIRKNPKYQAPCMGGWLCRYCAFINNPCRGI